MARGKGWIAGFALALAVLGTIQPAAAQSVNLWSSGVGGAVTADGLTFTVTGCTLELGGANQNSCSILGAEITVSGSTASPVLTITGANGGALFSSSTSGESAGLDELNVTVQVAAGSRHLVDSIAAGLTGAVAYPSHSCTYTSTTKTNCTNYRSQIELASETVTGATGSSNISKLNLGSLSSGTYNGTVNGYACSPQTTNCTFTGGHTVSVNLNIELNPSTASGYTLTLNSVSQTFGVVPEPLSLGMLSVGLVGLAFARRRPRA